MRVLLSSSLALLASLGIASRASAQVAHWSNPPSPPALHNSGPTYNPPGSTAPPSLPAPVGASWEKRATFADSYGLIAVFGNFQEARYDSGETTVSTDGGSTWKAIAADPGISDILPCGGESSGYGLAGAEEGFTDYFTTDAGLTWTEEGGDELLSLDPSEPHRLYGCDTSGGAIAPALQVSNDSAKSWKNLDSLKSAQGCPAVTVSEDEYLYAAYDIGASVVLRRSQSRGKLKTVATLPSGFAGFAADPTSGITVYASEDDGQALAVSHDGGASFQVTWKTKDAQHAIATIGTDLVRSGSLHVLVRDGDSRGALYSSSDGGKTLVLDQPPGDSVVSFGLSENWIYVEMGPAPGEGPDGSTLYRKALPSLPPMTDP